MNIWLSPHYKEREDGYTIIEILVVMLIMGLMAAVAVPLFLNQRKKAVDAVVQTDISNSGRLLIEEFLKGKVITRSIVINEFGVVSGNIDELNRVSTVTSTPDSFDLSSLKVSAGTVLIIKPTPVDGGVCLFAVNRGGDVAAKAPGYVFDSQAGGLMLDQKLSPQACANEAGELDVPPEVHVILTPGTPIANPSPTPTVPGTPTPTPSQPGTPVPVPTTPAPTPTPTPTNPTTTQTIIEKLVDRNNKCIPGNLTIVLTYNSADGILRWEAPGLSAMRIGEGSVITIYEVNSEGVYVDGYVVDITWDIIDSNDFSGTIDIGPMAPGNKFFLTDDDSTMLYGNGYKEYYIGDKDWSNNLVTKKCTGS